ncbi:hypothetical protein ACHAWU_006703 [Discostella pseudostelligera]|uniref:ACB domain-containing protein n=1 Tax=Discostella pseudostelligera TaxID=259834 RepID=A0ABD3N274_9STRA
MTTLASTFRAKTNSMKSWRPRNPPSNRDRLELYALHKQSVSGDAPPATTDDSSSSSSVADKAKLAAWRTKRGMTQAEAMQRYVEECDRQLRIYGTRDNNDNDGTVSASASSASTSSGAVVAEIETTTTAIASSTNGGEASASGHSNTNTNTTTNYPSTTTPQNTPAARGAAVGSGESYDESNTGNNGGGGILLCPRGLAAIPLLCAAASESRSAYLARLQVTHPSNGWWAKQEPLCLEVENPLSIPEKIIIALATYVEKISLVLSNYMGEGRAVSIMSPRVLQAFLWPVHNVFLCTWICLILATTYLGSLVMMCQTLLFGAKRTNAPLGRLFMEEVHPGARAVEALCEQHQAIGVRVAGLALMPLMMLCDLSTSVVGRMGVLAGSLVFVGMGLCSWWYWMCILPWLVVCGLCLATMSGWCFGLIELAGN